jgi:hypothetical protein
MKIAYAFPFVLMMAVGTAAADEPEAWKPVPAVVPLKVQVTLVRLAGDKTVARLPYTLGVNAGPHETQRLRMGIEVPIAMPVTDGAQANALPKPVQYKNVGVNVDCTADLMADGRFKLMVSVEQSSIYVAGEDKRAASAEPTLSSQPMFRTFRVNLAPVLRDGESQQFTAATDPVTGEVTRVEVALNVLK